MSILYLIFAEDMKAIHNKDYSVVKTLKAGPARASSFLVPDAGMEKYRYNCQENKITDVKQPVPPLPAH